MPFQRITWRAERIGWLVLAGILVLALLGLFSNGPLSSGTVSDGSGRLVVSYDRFERHGALTGIQLRIQPESQDAVAVRLDPDFTRSFLIERVRPGPIQELSGPEGLAMVFRPTAAGPMTVDFSLRARRIGTARSQIAIVGEPPAQFTQFVFP